jgi:hypothetical protein
MNRPQPKSATVKALERLARGERDEGKQLGDGFNVVPQGRDSFLVQSRLGKGDWYGVDLTGDEGKHATCTCPSYMHRGPGQGWTCKHIDGVRLELMLQGRYVFRFTAHEMRLALEETIANAHISPELKEPLAELRLYLHRAAEILAQMPTLH